MKDTYQKVLKRQDHKLIKHKLKLTQAQKDKLLANTLAEATKDRTGEKYHTTRNSCYQNVQRLINSVLPRRQRVREWLFRIPLPGGRSFGLYNPLATWPKAGPFMLSLKGLVKRRDRVKSLPKSMMRKYRKRVKPGKPAPASAVAFRGTHQTGYSPRNRPTVRSQQGSWRQLVSSRHPPALITSAQDFRDAKCDFAGTYDSTVRPPTPNSSVLDSSDAIGLRESHPRRGRRRVHRSRRRRSGRTDGPGPRHRRLHRALGGGGTRLGV
jgi:hypothetical protein